MAANADRIRNLKKSELGGVIFGCSNVTMRECLSSQLFGLPSLHYVYVQNVEPGLPLFLFNYDDRKLHGIYEAASSGKMNIDSYAWTGGGLDRTKFPAQVQIHVRLECQPLAEHQFKPIIADNYFKRNLFQFELDHAQASKLMSLFSSFTVGPRPLIQKSKKKKGAASNSNVKKTGPAEPPYLTDDSVNVNGSIETSVMIQHDEKNLINVKLEEPALSHEHSDANKKELTVKAACTDGLDVVLETYGNAMITSGKGKHENSSNSFGHPAFVSQLQGEIEELKAFKQEHTLKVAILEKELGEAKQQINQLENRCMILESISNPSVTLAGEESRINPRGFNLNLDQSIFLVGGYDGEAWSSALDSFSPSHDALKTLKSMSSARAYASVVEFGGELYVLGGGSNKMWFDTVESYCPLNNHWTVHPSLNQKRGCLGAAALNGKLIVVGGGNGSECFSDVEMCDPNVGRWISASSMLEKRFSLAAVEFRGALYAVGGYDGRNYLKSAERFDPREHSWSRICSMDARRGCHSLVVINEKLHAIGGYDGTTMIPSVEIYDPHIGTWMAGEPMTQARGYSTAAVLNKSIFVIAGIKSGGCISDLIECYTEGEGWQATNLKAVGKRCFMSAIVLRGT